MTHHLPGWKAYTIGITIKGLNLFTLRLPKESILCYSHTFENNLGIKQKYKKYLKESCYLVNDQHFSFKCFPEKVFVSKILQILSGLFSAALSVNGLEERYFYFGVDIIYSPNVFFIENLTCFEILNCFCSDPDILIIFFIENFTLLSLIIPSSFFKLEIYFLYCHKTSRYNVTNILL